MSAAAKREVVRACWREVPRVRVRDLRSPGVKWGRRRERRVKMPRVQVVVNFRERWRRMARVIWRT